MEGVYMAEMSLHNPPACYSSWEERFTQYKALTLAYLLKGFLTLNCYVWIHFSSVVTNYNSVKWCNYDEYDLQYYLQTFRKLETDKMNDFSKTVPKLITKSETELKNKGSSSY